MNTNEIYGIFLDIDGTLLGSCDDALEENIETIKRLRALGHKVFLNTGRATSFIPSIFKNNPDFDGIISGAGALSVMGDRVLVKSLMPYDVVKKYSEFAMENKLPAVIEGTDNMYHFGFSKGVASDGVEILVDDSWILLNADNIDRIITPDVAVEKLTILGGVPQTINDILGDDYYALRLSHHTEIIQKNHDKSKAMLEVAELLDIPRERTVAIGDSMNDYDMVRLAGIGVAMGNASEKLKDVADMVADDVNSAGVSKILKKIFNLK